VSNDDVIKQIEPAALGDQLTEILREGRAVCWLEQ
jgi:hypothetical protein